MMDATSLLICFVTALVEVSSVPPDICFQQFKWEDCGMPPKAVIYYYKSGSRCEVGFWRGCQPNPNMFADEYECVQTCIFSMRAKPHDYHQFQDNVIMHSEESTPAREAVTAAGNDTTADSSDGKDERASTPGGGNISNGDVESGTTGGVVEGGGDTEGGNTVGMVDGGGDTEGANPGGDVEGGGEDAAVAETEPPAD